MIRCSPTKIAPPIIVCFAVKGKWKSQNSRSSTNPRPNLMKPFSTVSVFSLISITQLFWLWNKWLQLQGECIRHASAKSLLPDTKRSLMSTRNFSWATWASVMRNTVLRFFTPAFRHRLARSICKNNHYQRPLRRRISYRRSPFTL